MATVEHEARSAQLFSRLRVVRGLSRDELAGVLEVEPDVIEKWETIPRYYDIPMIVREYLKLSDLSVHEVDALDYESSRSGMARSPLLYYELAQARDKLQAVRERIDKLAADPSQNPDAVSEVRQAFESVEDAAELTARLLVPARELLDVHLVPMSLLGRLNEYRNDRELWGATIGLVIGALMSMLVNLTTGGAFSIHAAVMGMMLILAGAMSLLQYIRLVRRSRTIEGDLARYQANSHPAARLRDRSAE
ncbi:MAG: hypothetical protein IPG72_01965 [Ardenticatenales bacterium]|nr:hypothetical protein [Ardenticatenales bacterium]